MLRSMFSAISGLRSHQMRMDVIGNNISNVNTFGFAASRLTFQESLAQTLMPSTGAGWGRGGTNSQQIGLGAKVGTIDMLMGVGAPQRTDRLLDLMIEGDGFFIFHNPVTPPLAGNYDVSSAFFSRAGNLYLDGGIVPDFNNFIFSDPNAPDEILDPELNNPWRDEELKYINLVSATGLHVMGWSLPFDSNIDEDALLNMVYDFANFPERFDHPTLVDADGLPIPSLESYYIPIGQRWINSDGQQAFGGEAGRYISDSAQLTAQALVPLRIPSNVRELRIDSNGFISGNFIVPISARDAVNPPTIVDDATGNVIANPDYEPNDPSYPARLAGTTVVFVPNFARIATATFLNPEGLERRGDNHYVMTANSGEAAVGAPGEGRNAKVIPGAVEMSNVDLSVQFTDMITTQRGFQANSRVITVSDTLLEELVNLKR